MRKRAKKEPEDTPHKRAGGQRVHQAKIDEMVKLRRQGLSYEEIAKRVGCSVRTVQRYVKNVEPELRIPQPNEQPEHDPRVLRRQLLREIIEAVACDNQLGGLGLEALHDPKKDAQLAPGPPSIPYLIEAERLVREALATTSDEMLRLIASNTTVRQMFLRATLGPLRADYRHWVGVQRECNGVFEINWRPRRDRSAEESAKVDFFWLGFDEEKKR
jgi:transcriptional regulator with XRE-family HTH domain